MELLIVYILLVQSFCVVLSNAPNSKLMDRVEILEKAILKENPCLNYTLEVRIEYLELFVKKFLTIDLVDQSVIDRLTECEEIFHSQITQLHDILRVVTHG